MSLPDDRGPVILLVDDYDLVRWGLLRALLVAGYDRAEAMGTAREAVQVMDGSPADLVIMDVTLAKDDAYRNGCLAVLAIVGRWPETRTALLTGWDPRDLPADCPVGLPIIQKPIGPQPFLARVAHLLSLPPWKPEAACGPA